MDKMDYKKAYKDLYLPKQKPMLIDVPPMTFLMLDGKGSPAGDVYQQAIQALYALTFTIKMSKMNGRQIPGYFEYVVPPLEGLWWSEDGDFNLSKLKTEWCWTAMIRQPEFVTDDVFAWAVDECRQKKKDIDVSQVRLTSFTEGLCVQMMHIGGYEDETRTVMQIEKFILDNDLLDESSIARPHHEIYLSDPRRTAIERLKTVLRLPVARNR